MEMLQITSPKIWNTKLNWPARIQRNLVTCERKHKSFFFSFKFVLFVSDYSIPNSRTSTPSTSALGIPRQFMQHQQQQSAASAATFAAAAAAGSPSNIYQFFDTNVLNDVEIEAQYLAASVDNLTENLCNLLHSISSITADNVETYKNAVNKLTDCMDGNIKNMYTIMAKTEEISNAMKPSEQIAVRM